MIMHTELVTVTLYMNTLDSLISHSLNFTQLAQVRNLHFRVKLLHLSSNLSNYLRRVFVQNYLQLTQR